MAERTQWRWIRWSNLPLRVKGFVVVAIPVLGLVGSQSAFLIAQRAYTRADQAVREATETRGAIRSILISALDAETSVRGFLLTGDRTLLYGLRQAQVAVPQHVARLERLASERAERAAVERIARLAEVRLSVADQLRKTVPGDDRQALLQQGRTAMSYLRTELNTLQGRVESELSIHTVRADRYRSMASATGAIGLAVGLLGGVWAATIFTTGVVRRVRRLEENAGRLARGEPLRSLPSGEDEIGRLGQAMEASARRLGEAKGLLQGVIDGTPDVVFVKDLDGRYLVMNRAGEEYLDRIQEEIVGRTDAELYDPELAATIRASDFTVIRTGDISVYESTDTSGQTPRIFLTTKGPFRDGSGHIIGVFGISREISDRVLAERERDRFFTMSFDLLCIADLEGRFVRLNPAWEKALGYPVEELIGRSSLDFVHPEDRERTAAETTWLAGGTETLAFENRYQHRNGTYRWFLWSSRADLETGRIYAAARDITERKLIEAQMEEVNAALADSEERFRLQAIVDDLTGLHNRRGFAAIGQHHMELSRRTGRPLAVLFADLDGMKTINDTFGHTEGDHALCDAADILRSTLRASDVVARLGGDEFCALLPDCPADQAAAVCTRIEEALREHRGSRPFELSLSLGVTVHEPGSPASFDDLIQRADAAMYEQKASRPRGG
jgi:diguanylate cyclase (GGDEF)-like protein/PAS domain S-box-containing protein